MKIKLIQYFVNKNEKYLELCNLSKEINERYAKLHNYDYQLEYITEDEIKKYYNKSDWNEICGYKVKFIQRKLEEQNADYLVFIDADAAVSMPQIKIEQLIDQEHQMFLSRGNEIWLQNWLFTNLHKKLDFLIKNNVLMKYYYDQSIMKANDMFNVGERLSYGNLMFNQGLFVIKNTPTTRSFFNQCFINQQVLIKIPYSKMPLDGRSISFTLMQEQYNNIYKFLNQQSQGGFYNSYSTKYNQDHTFLMHNFGSGMNIDQKIAALNKLKTNKHWSLIQQ